MDPFYRTRLRFPDLHPIFTLMKLSLILLLIGLVLGCNKKPEDAISDALNASNRYLYVAAGACYSGAGNATFSNITSSNLVFRINVASGVRESIIADYNASPAQYGDTPVAIVPADAGNMYVLVENTTTAGARRIEKVQKTFHGTRNLFSNNTTALSAQVRGMALTNSGEILISKSTAIEKLTASNSRIVQGGNPFISAPAAPCATSTTLISKTLTMNNQFVMFLHAAVGQNRFGFVKPSGYAAGGDCTVAQSSPNANSYPVAAVYDPVNFKLIVAYAGNSMLTDINSIYAYDITETSSSVTVGSANKIYDLNLYPTTYPYILYGISEMTYDPLNKQIYIATAVNTATTVVNYTIEKFNYAPEKIGVDNTNVLSRVGSTPFYDFGGDTKCISGMMVSN